MRTVPVVAATTLAAVAARHARDQAPFLRMLGSSIARPDAAGWVTDFLNAAYYRRLVGGQSLRYQVDFGAGY